MNHYPPPINIDMGAVPLITQMMYNGIRIDVDYFLDLSKEYKRRLKNLQQEIDDLCGHHLNSASPQQVQLKLQLMKVRDREGKLIRKTDAETLAPLAVDYPLIKLILKYKQLHKLKGTYVDKLPKMVDKNNRIHTSFSITTADTYRLASSRPNLQNISTRTKEGKRIRGGFIPDDGYVFVGRDYSAQELRWLANLSGDSTLIRLYRSNGDLHLETEKAIFGTDDKSNRNAAKTINFATSYGISARSLWLKFLVMGITQFTIDDCQEFLNRWFQKYPGVWFALQEWGGFARKHGYIDNEFGYRCYVPEVFSTHKDVRERGVRQACNFMIQGPSAAQTKLAMKLLDEHQEHVPTILPLLQAHDELFTEVKEEYAEEANDLLKYAMEEAVTGYKVPFDSEGWIAYSWNNKMNTGD